MATEIAVAALVVVLVLLIARHVAGQTVHTRRRNVPGAGPRLAERRPGGDDTHWTWAGTDRSSASGRVRLGEPDLQELDGAYIGLRVEPLAASLRH